MSRPLDNFIDELRDDPQLAAVADEFARAACAIEREARTNRHAGELLKAASWIIRHDDRTLAERIEALGKLVALPGPIVVNMYELIGWR
jgi:hypothetical protein